MPATGSRDARSPRSASSPSQLRVSVITVKRAYLELERQGVILTRQGLGSQIAPQTELADDLRRRQLVASLEEVCRIAAELGIERQALVAELRTVQEKQEQAT